MKISLTYSSAPRQVRAWTVEMDEGATVRHALAASDIFAEFPELQQIPLMLGIWGKRCHVSQLLRDGDRIEIYRALQVDPKVARRERFKRQGVKRAGLFSASRPGAKAGY